MIRPPDKKSPRGLSGEAPRRAWDLDTVIVPHGIHVGRIYTRGLLHGVRLFASLLACGDLAEARRLLDRAEQEARP